jgi:hypothetical protein
MSLIGKGQDDGYLFEGGEAIEIFEVVSGRLDRFFRGGHRSDTSAAG